MILINREAPKGLSLRIADQVCRFVFKFADMRVESKLEIQNKYSQVIWK